MPKKVTVEGEVIAKDGSYAVSEFYTEEFILDDAVKNEAQARSMIQAGLIADRLRKTVANFRRVRTCQVIGFESTQEKPESSEMDKALLRATELGCVPENITNYRRPDHKLKALQNAIELAEKRKQKPEKGHLEDAE